MINAKIKLSMVCKFFGFLETEMSFVITAQDKREKTTLGLSVSVIS